MKPLGCHSHERQLLQSCVALEQLSTLHHMPSPGTWLLTHFRRPRIEAWGQAGSQGVLFHQLDITDPVSVEAFAKWAAQDLGEIHVLVNNAGAPDWFK